jgi:hypothetical protein
MGNTITNREIEIIKDDMEKIKDDMQKINSLNKELKKEINNLKIIILKQNKYEISENKCCQECCDRYYYYENKKELKKSLEIFFKKHKPKYVNRVERIMDKFQGREKDLLFLIKQKFGEELDWKKK